MRKKFPGKMRWPKKKFFRIALIASAAAVIFVAGGIFLSDNAVRRTAEGRCYANAEDIPHRRVGLVLGTAKTTAAGRINLFYKYRIEAAAALFEAGKIDYLILSGDNSRPDYDEPTAMYNDLLALGVPENKMKRDYAGFRTLDSVVRAKEIFGATEIIVISQKFHDERAIYLAEAHDIDAIGLEARSPSRRYSLMTHIRELGARVAAVLDVWLGTGPKFLGPEIDLEEDEE